MGWKDGGGGGGLENSYTRGRGGASDVLPLQKNRVEGCGGGGGGHNKFWGSFDVGA